MPLSSKCLFVDVALMLFDLEWTFIASSWKSFTYRCKTIIPCGREWCAWNWWWRMICYTFSLAYNSGLLILLSVFLFQCHTAFQAWSYKKTFSRTWKPHKPKVAPSGMHVNTQTHIHTCTYTHTVSWLTRQKCIKIWTWNSSRRKWKVKVKSLSRVQFFVTLCSLPGSSLHGIFQARILEWVAISFSRGSSQLRDKTQVSCTAGRCFTLWATREVLRKKKYKIYIVRYQRRPFFTEGRDKNGLEYLE